MGKYLDYTSNKFTQEHYNRQYTYPYVAYSKEEDRVIYSLNKDNSDQPINPDYGSSEYLTFTALEDDSSVGLEFLSTQQTIEYSYDKSSWTNMDTDTTISLNTNNKVYLRGILSGDNFGETVSEDRSEFDCTVFNMTGKIAASGNCNSIWNYQDLNAPLKKSCGAYLFWCCTSLTTAPELPATTLADWCYNDMFVGCQSLTTAPELPATTLTEGCYSGMFSRCTSLTTAPVLPATTLADYCYTGMFSSCKQLTTAPELPATTLANYCYDGMFQYCTSLTTAPTILPATTLKGHCYERMFAECTSLITAPDLPATTLVDSCYRDMFWGCSKLNSIKCLANCLLMNLCVDVWLAAVSSTGTFYKHPDMNNWTRGVSGIPEGWMVVDAAI